MRNRFQKLRFQPKAEINLVPFIDIVLVLLVVFILVTPIVTQGVKVSLPKVVSSPITQKNQNNWILTIQKNRRLFLDRGVGRLSANRPTNIPSIASLVKFKTQKNPNLTLYVRADSQVSYGTVMKILGTLQSKGLSRVGLITKPVH